MTDDEILAKAKQIQAIRDKQANLERERKAELEAQKARLVCYNRHKLKDKLVQTIEYTIDYNDNSDKYRDFELYDILEEFYDGMRVKVTVELLPPDDSEVCKGLYL